MIAACKEGYFGKFCNQLCPSGTFGTQCGGQCFPNCAIEDCHHVNGCPNITESTIYKRELCMKTFCEDNDLEMKKNKEIYLIFY